MVSYNEDNIHEGHRKRLRELYLRNGIDGLKEHQILELLLFHAIPRRDVNPLAHRLINKFGSLQGVLGMEMTELTKVGLSENAALFLHLINDIMLYPQRSPMTSKYIKTTDDAVNFCFSLLGDKKVECMGIICLNAANKVLHYEITERGSSDKVLFNPRRIVDIAIAHGAHGVVLTHNHPSGNHEPSDKDKDMTLKIRDLLEPIDIKLYEHIIVAYPECSALMKDYITPMLEQQAKSKGEKSSDKYEKIDA